MATPPSFISNCFLSSISQQDNEQINDALVGFDTMEESMYAIASKYFQAVEPMKRHFIEYAQRSGLYRAMQRAVTIGLSKEPSQRNLCQTMVCFRDNGSITENWYHAHDRTVYCKNTDLASAHPDQKLISNLTVSHRTRSYLWQ